MKFEIGKYKFPALIVVIPIIFISGLIGYAMGIEKAKLSIRSGPYSDSIYEAQKELDLATSKIHAGDLKIQDHIENANLEISKIKLWSEKFIGIDSLY
jgi:hypothetical protein